MLMKCSESEIVKFEVEKVVWVKVEIIVVSLKKKCDCLFKEGGIKDLYAEVDAYKMLMNCNVC